MLRGCSALNSQVETIYCIRVRNRTRSQENEIVATESKLALYVNDKFVTEFLYSTGSDEHLVYGYLLSSGRISSKDEVDSIVIDSLECRVVLVNGNSPGNDQVDHHKSVSYDKMLEIRNLLLENQTSHKSTRGFHGAILYELSTNRWFVSEDIGRHNAVDKVIGHGLQESYKLSNSLLLLSGRLISNIVQKGINSGIPVLVSMTVSTDEGIKISKEHNRTLIGCLSDEGCWLYHEGTTKLETLK